MPCACIWARVQLAQCSVLLSLRPAFFVTRFMCNFEKYQIDRLHFSLRVFLSEVCFYFFNYFILLLFALNRNSNINYRPYVCVYICMYESRYSQSRTLLLLGSTYRNTMIGFNFAKFYRTYVKRKYYARLTAVSSLYYILRCPVSVFYSVTLNLLSFLYSFHLVFANIIYWYKSSFSLRRLSCIVRSQRCLTIYFSLSLSQTFVFKERN